MCLFFFVRTADIRAGAITCVFGENCLLDVWWVRPFAEQSDFSKAQRLQLFVPRIWGTDTLRHYLDPHSHWMFFERSFFLKLLEVVFVVHTGFEAHFQLWTPGWCCMKSEANEFGQPSLSDNLFAVGNRTCGLREGAQPVFLGSHCDYYFRPCHCNRREQRGGTLFGILGQRSC
jgi:hypothetical protein